MRYLHHLLVRTKPERLLHNQKNKKEYQSDGKTERDKSLDGGPDTRSIEVHIENNVYGLINYEHQLPAVTRNSKR